jgi:hypothetical protein
LQNEANKAVIDGERPEKVFYQIGYKSIENGDMSHVIDMFYDSLDEKDKYESD